MKERFTSKLLVEGNDDKHVILALSSLYSIEQNFDIVNCEGIENIFNEIGIRFKQTETRVVGILVDADTDIQKRWGVLKSKLSGLGFSLPDDLSADGLSITREDGVRVGIWIMPDNRSNGMLENFMTYLVPADDKLLPTAKATLKEIEEARLNGYSAEHRSKALIHTWLSWQEDPGTPLGLSITKRFLTTDTDLCKRFVSWVQLLFAGEAEK